MEAPLPKESTIDLDTTSVMFFDGVCNLCNGTVDFFIRKDKKHALRYAPLQGDAAKELLPGHMHQDLPSMALLDKGGVYQRSTAVLKAASKLGGLWQLVQVFLIVPRPIRDAVYNWIAKNRYRWFGKKDSCRLPTPEERAMFLK